MFRGPICIVTYNTFNVCNIVDFRTVSVSREQPHSRELLQQIDPIATSHLLGISLWLLHATAVTLSESARIWPCPSNPRRTFGANLGRHSAVTPNMFFAI